MLEAGRILLLSTLQDVDRMTERLKPCPFCGGEAELRQYDVDADNRWWYVACYTCGISMDPLFWNSGQTREETIMKWNRRVGDAPE